MPKQLILSHYPVELSIVEFDLDKGEDIHVSFTWERIHGPHINRSGMGPPYMDRIGKSGQITTHPFGLRLGTWLIQENLRKKELDEAEKELARTRSSGAPIEDIEVLEDTIKQLDLKDLEEAKKAIEEKRGSGTSADEIEARGKIKSLESQKVKVHDTIFEERYPDYEIIGQIGCGDLTMNEWNVAYLNNRMTPDLSKPVLVHLHHELLQYRTYSCLVKWKLSDSRATRLTIEEVRFIPETALNHPNDWNEMVSVQFGDRWIARGDAIDFAVSNQQIIRDGEIVPVVHCCHQFGDIRHLILMPNLNPPEELYPGESVKNGKDRPRWLFGQDQYSDIWLGEKEFIADRERNLLRAALNGPVLLPNSSGAGREQIRGAMQSKGYREVPNPLEPLESGEWRFVSLTPDEMFINIYSKRNTYAWNILGLSKDNRKIYSLVCKGNPGVTGYMLEEAAEFLLNVGVWNALLIDEGADTFQKVIGDDGELHDMVPRYRQRLRAKFIFARQREFSMRKEEGNEPS